MVVRVRTTGWRGWRGPQPGPEPAWARFTRVSASEARETPQAPDVPGKAHIVGLHALKPDMAAYRILGAPPASPVSPARTGQAGTHTGTHVERNSHNSRVYVSHLSRHQSLSRGEPRSGTCRIPVIGEIAAGQYDVTVALHEYDCLDYEGGVPVDRALARGGVYALRVRGTSMTHVGIEPGDVVVVRPQNRADNGDFVVAQFTGGVADGSEGLVTLKRFYRRGDHIFLQSATASTDPIILLPGRRSAADPDPLRILGVVTMIIKAD